MEQAEAKRSRFQAWKRGVLVVAAAGFVGLVLAEVSLRLAGMHFDASLFTGDPELGWALRPGARGWNASEGEAFVTVNRHGQLDAERVIEKPSSTYRIAILGDSMVEARQVPLELRFTQVMERELNRCAGRAVEVLNFGVPGYGTTQELILLRSRVWAYGPDLIVLGVHFGNDLYDNLRSLDHTAPERRPFFVRQGSDLVFDDAYRQHPSVSPARIRLHNWAADLMNRSSLLLLINQARVALRAPRPEVPESATPANSPDGRPPADYRRRWVYLEPKHPALIEAWLTTEALILRLGNEVQRRPAGFAMMYLPMMAETDSDAARREEFVRELGDAGHINYARNRLMALAAREGIRLLDPTQALLDHAVATHTFVNGFKNTPPNSGHLNEEGHRIVGEFMAAVLCTSEFSSKRLPHERFAAVEPSPRCPLSAVR